MRTRMLDREKIVLVDDLYPRSFVEYRTVASYAESMLQGAEFPPVKVAESDGVFYLLDGWHRFRALKQLKQDKISAHVVDIPREEWFAYAVESNMKHGRPMTQKEKIAVIFRLRKEGRSDDDIGPLMQMTTSYIAHLVSEKALVLTKDGKTGIPLKPALAEVKPKLKKKKVIDIEALQRSMSGQRQFSMIRQVADLLDRKLINDDDQRVQTQLDRLWKLMSDRFG